MCWLLLNGTDRMMSCFGKVRFMNQSIFLFRLDNRLDLSIYQGQISLKIEQIVTNLVHLSMNRTGGKHRFTFWRRLYIIIFDSVS